MKIAILSDIHEDYTNLLRAAKLIEQQKCDEIICLGDIAGFSVPFYTYFGSRDANACVRWVRDHCRVTVAGNHDLYAIRKVPQSVVRGFQFPEGWYSLPFSERTRLADENLWLYEDNELSALLDDDSRDFLDSLPETAIFTSGNTNCLLSHFIHPDITGSARQFLSVFNDLMDHLQYMKEGNLNLSFTGHMHCDGLVKLFHQHELSSKGFNRKHKLSAFDWVAVPSVSSAKNPGGFLIWDTEHHTVEAVSVRKKISML